MITRFAATRAALVALLQANAVALGIATVTDGRTDPFSKEDLPAINAVPGSHRRTDQFIDQDSWEFEIDLEVCTHGSDAFTVADNAIGLMYPLITGAASIKALVFSIRNEGGAAPEQDGADFAYEKQTITYRFECQTAFNSLA